MLKKIFIIYILTLNTLCSFAQTEQDNSKQQDSLAFELCKIYGSYQGGLIWF